MWGMLFCAVFIVYVPPVYAVWGSLFRAMSKSVKHSPKSVTKKIPQETAENIHTLRKTDDVFNQKKDFKDKALDVSKAMFQNGFTEGVNFAITGTGDSPDQRDFVGKRREKRASILKAEGRFGGGKNAIKYQKKDVYKAGTFQEQNPQKRLEKESVYIDDSKPVWMTEKPAWWIERQKKVRILGLLEKNNGLCFECSKISIALSFDSCATVAQLKKNGYLIKCSEDSFKWKNLYIAR